MRPFVLCIFGLLVLANGIVWFVVLSEEPQTKTVRAEPTRMDQSRFGDNSLASYTSRNLTKADLAWHAYRSYGWDCQEVLERGPKLPNGTFVITCSKGLNLRVQLRPGKHPIITNLAGTFEGSLFSFSSPEAREETQ